MTRRPTRRAAGWLLLATLVLAGCGTGGDQVDATDAGAALEGQRTDVRTAAAALVTGAVTALEGRPSHTTGRFEGCESAFNEEYRTFRYRATARIDVARGAAPDLPGLAPVLADAGFGEATPGDRPAGRTLDAGQGDLAASFSQLDGANYVLLSVEGPCVEVPKDERADWAGRRDPASFL